MDYLPHIHVAALHSEPGYRSVVPGIGVLGTDGPWLIGAGVYRNSNPGGNLSTYFMGGAQPLRIGPVKIGAVAGMVNGYERANGKFAPFIAGVASWGHQHLTIMPPYAKEKPWVIQYSFTLKP